MRTLLLLFCLPAFSQTLVFPFDTQLRDYLKLTQVQVEQLQRNLEESQQRQSAASARINIVSQEIATETQKASPSAMELGLRYQEIETICRELDDPRRVAYQKQMQILDAEQRGLAAGLGDAARLASFVASASALFLIPQPPPVGAFSVYSGTPLQGFSGSAVPADLAAYLSMPRAQIDRIQALLIDYQGFFTARSRRSVQVLQELDREFGRDIPTPQDLGDRYVELETLRREIGERETSLRNELRAILTPEQLTLTQTLATAQTQASLLFGARYFLLIAPEPLPKPASIATSFASLRFGPSGLHLIYRSCIAGAVGPIPVRIGDFAQAPQ
jgi:hypothetical protein